MTNLDRLRKMSDEEIFIYLRTNFSDLDNYFCKKITTETCRQYNTCVDCKIAWLKKEYKGDDNND